MRSIDMILVVFGLIILISCFIGKHEVDKEQFNYNTMNCIKGVFSIMIVMFHLSQHIDGGVLFMVIGDTGYLSVAVFFFISGYGLYTRIVHTGGGIAVDLSLAGFRGYCSHG